MKGNQRIALTKRLLQEALLRILKTKPLDKINVTELCGESGINRATFYRHYSIPRDVLMDMQMQFVAEIHESLDMAAIIDDPTAYLVQLCTYLCDHSDLIKIFIRNNSEDDIVYLCNEVFQNFLKQNQNLYLSRQFDDIELKLITVYMAGGGYFMLRQWLMEDIEKSPEEIAHLVLTFLTGPTV